MYKYTPAMGWDSWNTFGANICDQVVRDTADTIVAKGLDKCGYEYVVIDDCWAMPDRDENGRLVPIPEKFPHGMKALADYVHSKGLKFGIYTCVGNFTCGGYPASYEHEFIDAATFAEWGVDYVKCDYCYRPDNEVGEVLYRRLALALANCGREIMLNACSWGVDETHRWIKNTGAHSWRSTTDIWDNFGSVKQLYDLQKDVMEYNGRGCFNDMDMLIIGMGGEGNTISAAPGQGDDGTGAGCTFEEYRTHMSIWSMFASPLLIGADVAKLSDRDLSLLTNRAVLAINQDPAATSPFRFQLRQNYGPEVWGRVLENGDLALLAVNFTDCPQNAFIPFTALGLNTSCGVDLQLTDLWSGQDIGTFRDQYRTDAIAPHDCRFIRARLVPRA